MASRPDVANIAAAQATGEAVVLAAGDVATCGRTQQVATGDLIESEPGSVLALGDLAYDSGTTSQFNNCYDPAWGNFKNRTYPAPGNHEYQTSGASGYYAYWGARAGDPSKGYYSFDLGAWHVISLNSNCGSIGGCGAGSAQETWLRADLAAHPTTCVLAYWHHPRFSSGNHGNSTSVRPLWQALYDYGADVVLAGHDHHYERFSPQDALGNADAERGIREFVVGTAGRGLYNLSARQPNSEVAHNQSHGVLRLVLSATGYQWEFLSVLGSTFTDSGSASCSAASGSTPTATATRTPTSAAAATNTPLPAATASATPVASATQTTGSLVFTPAADARVEQANPSTNFGTTTTLISDGSPVNHSYLRFNVSGLSGPALRATLRLWVVDPTGNGPPVSTCASTTWDETSITWNNKPATSGARNDKGAIAGGIWLEYDVTSFVTGNGGVCLALVPQSSDGLDLSSRQGANPPQLVITGSAGPTATPTPVATLAPTATRTATATATASATRTPTVVSTNTPAPTAAATSTSRPTVTPTAAATSTTPPVSGLLFSDGFESGDFSKWATVRGLAIQQDIVANGAWAVRGANAASNTAWARAALPSPQTELYARINFYVVSQGNNELTLIRFETSAAAPILSVYVAPGGYLAIRRGSTSATSSPVPVSMGVWHEVQVRMKVNGASGQTEVWLDGARADMLSATANLGTAPATQVRIGEDGTWRRYDVAFDDVAVSTSAIASIGAQSAGRLAAQSASVPSPTETPMSTPTATASATGTATPTDTVTPTITETAPPTETPAVTPTIDEPPEATATTEPSEETPVDVPPTDVPPTEAPTPVPTVAEPTPTEAVAVDGSSPYHVAQTGRSKSTVAGTLAIDGDPTTVWQTAEGSDPGRVAVLRLDLGAGVPINRVRLLPGPNGLIGTVTIETSDDGETWSYFGVPGALDAEGWIDVPRDPALTEPVSARHVRIVCVNDGSQAVLGGVAEVEVLPPANG